MTLKPGAQLGSYEVLSLVGTGGMGEVYRARDTRLGREVAIKVLPAERMGDEDRRRRFVKEARAASALNHPNIVTIHEIESADGNDFIVMEYVPGKTLDSVIPRQGMRLGEVLRIAIPIADAVARAHAAGIVHRDLKPANVVIGPDGAVKVLDFGLAKLVGEEEAESPKRETRSEDGDTGPLSRPGMVAGTAEYMSPEQASGRKVDARSDVFSFGAVLYEMVTGRRAFAGSSKAETLAAVLKEQPRAPSELTPGVPRDLEKVILRCLQKDPDRRVQHMGDVKVELQEIKEESDSRPLQSPVPADRSRLRWLVAGLGGALALAVAGWFLWRSREPEIPPPFVVSLTSTPGIEGQPTFSPDGNQVAFAWEGENQDNWDIYVKMVGSTETRRLTTDAGVDMFPSWSPDGRQIAFIRTSRMGGTGMIHLVSPLGGSDRRLSEQPVTWGQVSWSPDGRWLATAAGGFGMATQLEVRGIRLVAVPDGAAHSITSPSAPTTHVDPAFSTDGHHLAYASCISTFACHVDVVELEADYAPKGTARRLTRNAFWFGGLTFTRDGKSVVYDDRSNGRLWRVGIAGDRAPERIEVAGFDAMFPTAAVSKDRLAFERVLTNQDIYRFEVGRPPRVVAASSRADYNPNFSPDGRRFAFESGRGGEGDEIWLAASDGSNPMRLTNGPGIWQGSPRWSPDGTRIAFDSQDKDGRWGVWTIDVNGGSPRRLTSEPDSFSPSWSHDGQVVYFTANRTGTSEIWRVPASGGSEERVTHSGGSHLPYESADGKEILFVREGSESPLFAVPVAGGPERKVIDCVALSGFTVGAAGVYHVGCTADRGSALLYLLDPATGRDRLLGKLDRYDANGIAASPDGKMILYERLVGEGSDLMMIENFR